MYKLLIAILRFFVRLLWGLEVEGLENIPEEGGALWQLTTPCGSILSRLPLP